jgi:HK97 family phage portal protein
LGLLDLFRRKSTNAELRTIVREYYGNNPFLFARSYAAKIYDIPEVRTAIESFADIFSSIPKYVERVNKNGNIDYYENQMSRVLTLKANPLQNSTQFWKNTITRLMLDNNVFIEPIWDSVGNLSSLYVLPKDNFKFELNGNSAKVTFTGINKTYNLSQLIYLNRFAEITGGTNNSLGLYETVIQSLAQQAINVASPNKVKAFLQGTKGSSPLLRKEDRAGTMEDFKLNMDENVQGVSYLDGQWTVTPINWQENDVNRELMQFVVNTVYNYFGITTEIINNKASEVEYQLFVRNKVEPLARQIEQEFTSKLFTQREIEFGNKIELDTFNLTVGTMQAKAQLFSVGLRQGVLSIDDAREMIGLAPLPDGLGQAIRVTADTMDIKYVNEMQKAQKGVKENEANNNSGKTSTTE